jgi:hypothetical protein
LMKCWYHFIAVFMVKSLAKFYFVVSLFISVMLYFEVSQSVMIFH